MRNRSSLNALIASPALLGLAVLVPATAVGQESSKAVSLQAYESAIGPNKFLTIDSASVPSHLQFGIGLAATYQSSPFSLQVGDNTTDVIENQATADLTAALGLFDSLQLGFALPVTALLTGNDISSTGTPTGTELSGGGLGDPRIQAKYQLIGHRFGGAGSESGGVGSEGNSGDGSTNAFFLAAAVGVTVPVGDKEKFLGEQSVTVRPRLLAEVRLGDLRLGAHLGAILRAEKTVVASAEFGHQALYAAAAEYFFHEQVGFIAEVFGRRSFTKYVNEAPLEVDGGLRVKVAPSFHITAGGGTGLQANAVGSPAFRGFLALAFQPDFADADGDGVYDDVDRCPGRLEDMDGYNDSDGCPDPDNDGDTLLDVDDQCPNEAEDLDQFEDEDGCPEPDNDGDGVPDLNDACPAAAEDGLGKNPNDGCPSHTEDSDGDGIPDTDDSCDDEPEDMDGFEDEDGCPDIDNDEDTIPDQFDTCPDAAEDLDGFGDEDGCPDPDNDGDGIPDARDTCPDEPEDLNGNLDDDGCPDTGSPIVYVDGREIVVAEPALFRGSQLTPGGQTALDLVARLLKARTDILRVSIRIAAPVTPRAYARASAVERHLLGAGISHERFQVVPRRGRHSAAFFIEDLAGNNNDG